MAKRMMTLAERIDEARAVYALAELTADRDRLRDALQSLMAATDSTDRDGYNEEAHDIAESKARDALSQSLQHKESK